MIKHNMEQGSHEWHEIRKAKLTSTGVKTMLADAKGRWTTIDEMIAEEISGMSDDEDGYISDDMQRGTDLEPLARKEYELMHLVKVEQYGFLQSERWPRLGVSPDGLVGNVGAIEMKCPKTKTHVKRIRENILPKEYQAQTLTYFLVHEELEWVDFMSYDPRFTVQPVFIKRVNRQEMAIEIKEASLKLDAFFKDFDHWYNKIVFGDDTSVLIASHDTQTSATIIENALKF